eukprot:984028_1
MMAIESGSMDIVELIVERSYTLSNKLNVEYVKPFCSKHHAYECSGVIEIHTCKISDKNTPIVAGSISNLSTIGNGRISKTYSLENVNVMDIKFGNSTISGTSPVGFGRISGTSVGNGWYSTRTVFGSSSGMCTECSTTFLLDSDVHYHCSDCGERLCEDCFRNERERYGQTAVMLAHSLGHHNIVQYLIRHANAKSVVSYEEPLASTMDDELFTVTLPQSVYSLPFVFPFAFQRHRVGCMFHSSMNAFLLLLNFIIQVAFVIYTRDISAKGNGKKNWDNCTEINRFFLFVLSIFLFCVKTTADIFESLKLVLYLYDFPQANDRFEILKVQIHADGSSKMSFGMQRHLKLLLFLLVLAPKLAIAMCLFVFGSYFLITAEQEADLILNAVALAFVTEADELLYQAFVSNSVQKVIEDLPGIDVKDHRTDTNIVHNIVCKLVFSL